MNPDPIVFVIDDDPSVRRAMDRLLRAEGFKVETFASGAEFLGTPDHDGVGCIVLDVRMPGLSGFEVVERLTARCCALPIILITAHGSPRIAARAMQVGCASFLAKPFDEDDLLSAVRLALREQKQP